MSRPNDRRPVTRKLLLPFPPRSHHRQPTRRPLFLLLDDRLPAHYLPHDSDRKQSAAHPERGPVGQPPFLSHQGSRTYHQTPPGLSSLGQAPLKGRNRNYIRRHPHGLATSEESVRCGPAFG